MGRKKKKFENVKTSKTIRLHPSMWKKIKDEQKLQGHKYFITTIENILLKYFKK